MATKRYNRRSKDEWRNWVERWRTSGLGGTRFAEQHGLSDSALYRWARIFEDEDQPAVAFEQVRVREAMPSASVANVVEIVAGTGWVIRVSGAVDVDQLRAVLEVVGSC